jgi:hypothetical protein
MKAIQSRIKKFYATTFLLSLITTGCAHMTRNFAKKNKTEMKGSTSLVTNIGTTDKQAIAIKGSKTTSDIEAYPILKATDYQKARTVADIWFDEHKARGHFPKDLTKLIAKFGYSLTDKDIEEKIGRRESLDGLHMTLSNLSLLEGKNVTNSVISLKEMDNGPFPRGWLSLKGITLKNLV